MADVSPTRDEYREKKFAAAGRITLRNEITSIRWLTEINWTTNIHRRWVALYYVQLYCDQLFTRISWWTFRIRNNSLVPALGYRFNMFKIYDINSQLNLWYKFSLIYWSNNINLLFFKMYSQRAECLKMWFSDFIGHLSVT